MCDDLARATEAQDGKKMCAVELGKVPMGSIVHRSVPTNLKWFPTCSHAHAMFQDRFKDVQVGSRWFSTLYILSPNFHTVSLLIGILLPVFFPPGTTVSPSVLLCLPGSPFPLGLSKRGFFVLLFLVCWFSGWPCASDRRLARCMSPFLVGFVCLVVVLVFAMLDSALSLSLSLSLSLVLMVPPCLRCC